MVALGELFKQSLNVAVGGTAAIFDYGFTEDFLQLWETDAGAPAVLKKVNGKQAIIIVWDGRSLSLHDEKGEPVDDPGSQLLASHLTPLDWALALSIKVLGESKLLAGAANRLS